MLSLICSVVGYGSFTHAKVALGEFLTLGLSCIRIDGFSLTEGLVDVLCIRLPHLAKFR